MPVTIVGSKDEAYIQALSVVQKKGERWLWRAVVQVTMFGCCDPGAVLSLANVVSYEGIYPLYRIGSWRNLPEVVRMKNDAFPVVISNYRIAKDIHDPLELPLSVRAAFRRNEMGGIQTKLKRKLDL